MAIVSPPYVLQAGSHPASTVRQMLQAATGSPVGSFTSSAGATSAGGGHGVVGTNDLKVSQKGTPNMSVDVAQGLAFIRGTESAHQGVYQAYNDATVNVTIAAADSTNPRRDLIVVQVRDSAYSGSSDDVRIVAVTGTPAASPSDPTLPANSLVLARVTVAAGVSSILNAAITDFRRRAYGLGGTVVCTSSTRPSSPFEGQLIYETDTDKVRCYNGSAWFTIKSSSSQTAWTAYTPTWTNLTVGNGTQDHSYYQDGPTVHVRGSIEFGSTTSISGTVTLALPVTPKSSTWFIGIVRGQDASASFARFVGSAETNTAIWGSQMAPHFDGLTQMAASVPFGWTTSDSMTYSLTYEAATAA